MSYQQPSPRPDTTSFSTFVPFDFSTLTPSEFSDCRTMAYEAVVDAHCDGTQADINRAEAFVEYLSSIVPTGQDDDHSDLCD